MGFATLAATRREGIHTHHPALHLMHPFAHRPAIPAQLPFCQPLTTRTQGSHRPRHEHPPRATLEFLGRVQQQRFHLLGQFHPRPSKKSFLGVVYHTGQFSFRKSLNLNPPLRTRATRSSFIIAGSSQANIIAVLARGSKIDLYVNQHLIDSVEDNNYRDGTIGVLAKALDLYRPTEVAFSDARVWTF